VVNQCFNQAVPTAPQRNKLVEHFDFPDILYTYF
jgi:hypothetical protein